MKRLPLSAVEAYVLSRLDGQLDLDAVAEMIGLDAAEVARVGAYLVELGAAMPANGGRRSADSGAGSYAMRPPASEDRATESRPRRRDPRAEETLMPPPIAAPASPKTTRPPRTVRPPKAKTIAPPRGKTLVPPKGKTIAPPKGKTIAPPRTMRPPRTVRPPRTLRPDANAPDDSAADSISAIDALEARVSTGNHYEVLGVARDADKKTIKRAYFALAAEAHPDRFFQKKIGTARARVEKIFHRITEAHDALTDPQTRKAYDARLPPMPVSKAQVGSMGRKSSRGMKAVSRRMAAVHAAQQPPAEQPDTPPVSSRGVVSAPLSPPVITLQPMSAPPISAGPISAAPASVSSAIRPPPVLSVSPAVSVTPAATTPTLRSASHEDAGAISGRAVARAADLRAGMLAARTQERVEMLVKAGEDALAANDIIGAANSYRLALEHREDMRLRFIYEDLDARSRTLRSEKNMTAARGAETELRWADAAVFLQRAHEARPDCDVANRAAVALRLSDGDMNRAFTLAEDAVRLAPRNPHYRLTLAAVCLSTKRSERAKEESEEARRLAPKDEHIQALGREIAKKA